MHPLYCIQISRVRAKNSISIPLSFEPQSLSLHIHPPYCIQISRVSENNSINISLSFEPQSLYYVLCMSERINKYVETNLVSLIKLCYAPAVLHICSYA